MKENSYEKEVARMKKEILAEIRELVGLEKTHGFFDTFYACYLDGETAVNEVVTAIDVHCDGAVVFVVTDSLGNKGIEIYEPELYSLESLIDTLDRLTKEITGKKEAELYETVKANGGRMEFDGNFAFEGKESDTVCLSRLDCLFIKDGEVRMYAVSDIEDCVRDCSFVNLKELDRIIAYAKEQSTVGLVALTDEQQIIVARIKHDLTALSLSGASIFLDNDYGTLFAMNTGHVELWPPYDKEKSKKIDIQKLPESGVIGSGFLCYTSEGILVEEK